MGYELVESDTGSVLRVTPVDAVTGENISINASGFSMLLRFRIRKGNTKRPETAIEQSMTISTVGSADVADYTFQAGELEGDELIGEVQMTKPSGLVITSLESFVLPIRRRLA